MMDINTAANIAEIAGGIAILVSLTYAGFQIRQSNQIAKVESIRSVLDNSFLDEYDIAAIGRGFNSFDSLDNAEKWAFHSYFMRFFNHYYMAKHTKDFGLIDTATLDGWTHVIAESITTPGGQQYWESGARDSYGREAVEHLEDYIRNNSAAITPYNQRFKWMSETE